MKNITSVVHDSLREKIMKGDYSPSESLPEQDLAQQYSVSRNTIKKVLLMLEKENLVVLERNKGAKVRSYSMAEVLEFLELRSCLEGFIAKLAVPAMKPENIEQMREVLVEMKGHYERRELLQYSACNQRFHQALYDACPNRTLVEMTMNLKRQMSKYNTKTILIPGRDYQSMAEHEAIFIAVTASDSAGAAALVSRHILNVRKTFEEHFALLF
jgi:DNA-binding GntR family transcriptional regulator